MKEAAIHAAAVQESHGARVAVRQNRFGAVLVGDLSQPRGDGIQRFVPGNPLEFALAFRANALLRIEQPVGEYSRSKYRATLPHRNPRVTGCSGFPRKWLPLPSSTLMSREQQSGQSSAQTECRTSGIISIIRRRRRWKPGPVEQRLCAYGWYKGRFRTGFCGS